MKKIGENQPNRRAKHRSQESSSVENIDYGIDDQVKIIRNNRGRPTKYTEAVAAQICDRLANGESLRAICANSKMPSESCVRGWVLDDREGFYTHYARARNVALDRMADEIIEIADGQEDASTKRIRFDARRWYLSKLAPKRYGERHQLEHSVRDGVHADKTIDEYTDEELMAIIRTGQESAQ